MTSEYDPLGAPADPLAVEDDLEPVQRRFERASRPYLSSPWTWLAWALLLPAAALATPRLFASGGAPAVLLAWSVAVLLGGGVEMAQIVRGRRRRGTTPLAAWVLRVQGNLSLVAVALSIVLVWQGFVRLLPGLWLLLLGHSLYLVGGLASRPLRTAGLIFQAGGLAALWPGVDPLLALAVATCAGNLRIAWGLRRRA